MVLSIPLGNAYNFTPARRKGRVFAHTSLDLSVMFFNSYIKADPQQMQTTLHVSSIFLNGKIMNFNKSHTESPILRILDIFPKLFQVDFIRWTKISSIKK